MRPSSLRPPPLTAVLILVNLGFAAVLSDDVWEGTQTQSLLAIAPRSVVAPEPDVAPPSWISDRALQEKPLLYTSRRLYTPPPPNAAPATPPKPDYQLVGTFVIPAKPTVALLSHVSGASRKVKAGDELDGWLVQMVETHRVLLQFADTTFEISNGAKAIPAGMRLVPLPRLSHPAPVTGIRSLGSTAQGIAASSADLAPTSSSPRLYRPPPK